MYALLCNYASDKDHCWPSQKTLAARLACSVSSIKNYLAELVRERLIEVRHENYRSSVYYILQPEALRKRAAPAGDQPKYDSGQPESGHINNLSKQQEENSPLPPMKSERKDALSSSAPSAGGVGSAELDFETAWESYPRKEAKGFARMAWFKLLRSGQLPSLQELLSAIARSSASESWQKEQGRFIPQMANWLRGQRWLDPTLPVSSCGSVPDPRMRQLMRQKEEQEQRERSRQCREKKCSVLCSGPLPRNSMLPTMKQWLSASGCTCIRCVVRHRLRMSLRQQAGTSWPFCGRERGKLRKSAI